MATVVIKMIVAMAMITLTGPMIRSVGGVVSNPPPTCDGNSATESYTNNMAEVLGQLQLGTPNSDSLTASLAVGVVGGQARCYGGADVKQACSECLSVAQIKLVVWCKGREFGSTYGTDQFGSTCSMGFYPVPAAP